MVQRERVHRRPVTNGECPIARDGGRIGRRFGFGQPRGRERRQRMHLARKAALEAHATDADEHPDGSNSGNQ